MKDRALLKLCWICAGMSHVSAFSLQIPQKPSVMPETSSLTQPTGEPILFPKDMELVNIEGGGTVRTYHMPQNGERVQMMFTTNGRPMKAKIELWLGPGRRTHQMIMDCQDGSKTPYRALLKFKKGPQVLKVSTNGNQEFPLLAAVRAVPDEVNGAFNDATLKVWKENNPIIIQGGDTDGKYGAVTTFNIPDKVESVQCLFWSKDVGRKSCKAMIEVLQGPVNKKQVYDLHLSGGSQPFHVVLATPGEAVTIRMRNKNFLEFPFKAMVIPFETSDQPLSAPLAPDRQWWM